MRVLIVKTSSMGDVLHTLPALTDAQQAIPEIKFDWVVEEGFAQIPSLGTLPLSELFLWQYVAGVKPGSRPPIKAERKAFREALQAENYDAVIDAQGLVKKRGAGDASGAWRKAWHGLANRSRTFSQPVLQS